METKIRIALGELGATWEDPEVVVQNILEIIQQSHQSHCDELVRLLEAKKAPVPLGVSKSPEANIGIGSYNQAIDQALTIVKEVYKSK